MMKRKQFLVEVLFYKDIRETPPILKDCIYRPHFVVKGTSDYLGVWFIDGDNVKFGIKMAAIVETIYDKVNYSILLRPDNEFYILEVATIVG